MNGYLSTSINQRQEEGCMLMHANGGKYDNIPQFTEKTDLIIRGLSNCVDALYYNDNEWGRHSERLRIYVLSPG